MIAFRTEVKYLNTYDLAERFRVHIRTIERWRREGKGPAWVMIEGRVRYPLDGVIEYEKSHIKVKTAAS